MLRNGFKESINKLALMGLRTGFLELGTGLSASVHPSYFLIL